MRNPYKNKSLLSKVQAKAKRIGVSVKASNNKNKKIDVYKKGKKVASIGDTRYKDFLLYKKTEGAEKANKRRRLYKIRHNKHRNKRGTKSYYADKLLW